MPTPPEGSIHFESVHLTRDVATSCRDRRLLNPAQKQTSMPITLKAAVNLCLRQPTSVWLPGRLLQV